MSERLREQKQSPNGSCHPWRRLQLAEVAVFLFLLVPTTILSVFGVAKVQLSFPMVAGVSGLRDLALLSLVGFFLWRNGEPVASIGWVSRHAWQELLVGLGLFVPAFYSLGLFTSVLREVGLPFPESPPAYLIPHGTSQHLLAVVFLVVVAVSEETIFRGYLLRRFTALTDKPAVAVALSAGIFALGHGYQGLAGMIAVGVLGLLFAVVYLWRGSLIAPMVMHFLQDFMGLMVVPSLST